MMLKKYLAQTIHPDFQWLYGDLNLNFAIPRNRDLPKGQDFIPTAQTFTSAAGFYMRLEDEINGGISYRYLHKRPTNADYSLTVHGYFLTDLTANFIKKKYNIGLSVENLLNQKKYESQLEYVSRIKYETATVDEVSYSAGVTFFAKFRNSIFF